MKTEPVFNAANSESWKVGRNEKSNQSLAVCAGTRERSTLDNGLPFRLKNRLKRGAGATGGEGNRIAESFPRSRERSFRLQMEYGIFRAQRSLRMAGERGGWPKS